MSPLRPDATPTDQFSYIIEGLIRSANAYASTIGIALLWVIHHRLTRMRNRFRVLAEQLAAGIPRRVNKPRAAASRRGSTFVGPILRLPRDRSWLIGMTPEVGIGFAYYLDSLLTKDAAMMALVSSDPRFGRILRPLYHMLGRDPPACVPKLPPRPPRVRKPRAAKPRAPRPIRQVTGRALLKYLPWKKPRPLMKPDGSGMGAPPGMKGLSISRKSKA